MKKHKVWNTSLAVAAGVLLVVLLVASADPSPGVWAQSPIPTPSAMTTSALPTSQANDLSIKNILTVGALAQLIAAIIIQVVGAIFGVNLLKTAAAKEDLLRTTYEQKFAVMGERLTLESEKNKPLQELLEARSKLLEAQEEELARTRAVLNTEREALRKERKQLTPPEPAALREISPTPQDRQRLDELTRRIDKIEQLSLQQVSETLPSTRPVKSARDYLNDGSTYQALGRYEEAIAAYQRAIELDSNYAYPHNNLGNAYSNLGWNEEAIAAYQRAIELNPNLAYPHNNLGLTYHNLGRHEEAIAAFQHAIELDPNYASPHSSLGDVYRDLGRNEEAIAAYQRAIELEPNVPSSHVGLAGVYRHIGDADAQARYVAEARRLLKSNDHHNLACLESIAGNVEAAMGHLAKVLEKAPGLRTWARRDPDLAFIRDDPRFRELVGSTSD